MNMLERLFYKHLEDDEELYVAIHKHWVHGLKDLALPTLSLFASWALLYYLPFIPMAILVVAVDIGILVWMLRNFFDYYLDAWLITNTAVIDVEWHGWFHRQSTSIDYSSIEGVSYEIEGILGTIFGFGTVSIEKISTGSVFSIEDVKRPRDVESTILACQESCIRTKNMKDSSAIKDIIAEIVAERMYLKERQEEGEEVEVE